jgi:hypothetical protein
MRITESTLRRIIREEARQALQEMPYADSLESRDSPEPDMISAVGGELTVNRSGAKRFASSKKFKTLAKKHFSNIRNNIWLAPMIGAMPSLVSEDSRRMRAEPLRPDGVNRLRALGYNLPDRIKGNDVVILYTSMVSVKYALATPWMIVHAMFDTIPETMSLCPSFMQIENLYDELAEEEFDNPALARLLHINWFGGWFDALTMASARADEIASVSDAYVEMMCQELLTSGGLRLNLEAVDPEYHEALLALSDIVKQCAVEFRQNIGGKLIIVAVN